MQVDEENVESDFIGPELTIDEETGELSVDTSTPLKLKGFVTAFSQSLNAQKKSDMLYVNVCGYENITLGLDD